MTSAAEAAVGHHGWVAGDRALIFDFDGLIVDTEGLYASSLIAVLAARGVRTDLAAIGHLFGSTGPANEAAWAELLVQWGGELDLAALEDLIRAHAGTGFDELPLLPASRTCWRRPRTPGGARPLPPGRPGGDSTSTWPGWASAIASR